MIPMHYFSAYTLDRFLARVRQDWDVEIADVPSLLVSKTSLPAKPKVAGAARPLSIQAPRPSLFKNT